jgi:hypothetical protein
MPLNPYFEFGPRPFRAARLRSYIVREHRSGRSLTDILDDPYVRRCGSASFCWSVLEDPRTLHALGENDCERIARLGDGDTEWRSHQDRPANIPGDHHQQQPERQAERPEIELAVEKAAEDPTAGIREPDRRENENRVP